MDITFIHCNNKSFPMAIALPGKKLHKENTKEHKTKNAGTKKAIVPTELSCPQSTIREVCLPLAKELRTAFFDMNKAAICFQSVHTSVSLLIFQ